MDTEREIVEADVVFVGGGPASLAGAIHLMNQIEMHNEAADQDPGLSRIDEPKIVVLEKGAEPGSHGISGAVMDPRAIAELVPDWRELEDFPLERWVEREAMLVLSETGGLTVPVMPPEFQDHGKPIISIGRFQKWLADIATERGVEILSGTAGWNLLYGEDGKTVTGVRTRDRGLDGQGKPKDEYEPGADVIAKVTILGEGPRGTLTRILMEKHGLQEGRNQMAYETGCKEVLELPKGSVKEGFVYLTAGYPLGLPATPGSTFGGAFIYSMGGDRVCIGLLAVLDAKNPDQDVQYLLQKLKLHPKIREILKGGRVIKYGAKAVTVGGWGCIPKLYAPGAMIIGDSASFLNAARIKGIHLAMKSGMLAAETAFDALQKGDSSEAVLKGYKERVDASWIREEMESSQNFHTDIAQDGLAVGGAKYMLAKVLGPGKIRMGHEDHEGMQKAAEFYGKGKPRPVQVKPGRYEDLLPHYDDDPTGDSYYVIDKLSAVYLSGTIHDEHQPCHLKVADTDLCVTRCAEEYGNPCERFCPAQVYNIVEDPTAKHGKRLQVDFSNCVHCKTCDIRDPYQNIKWVPPEGGEGPEYDFL